jgi:hypothetical protein
VQVGARQLGHDVSPIEMYRLKRGTTAFLTLICALSALRGRAVLGVDAGASSTRPTARRSRPPER